MYNRPSRSRGFTLIEIMAVTGLVSSLALAALPMVRALGDQRAAEALQSSFASSLMMARNAATARGEPVAVCTTGGLDRCALDAPWNAGWQLAAGASISLETVAPAPDLHLTVVDQTGLRATHMAFTPQGFVAGDRQYYAQFCAGEGAQFVVLERSGRLGRIDSQSLPSAVRAALPICAA